MRIGHSTHIERRVCRSCKTAVGPQPRTSDFRTARGWSKRIRRKAKLRAHWLISFRPRAEVQDEMWRLNIPIACAAVRGEFGERVLGKAFRRCVALVSLMLRGCGSLDLVLITKSGDVAIGECKLRDKLMTRSSTRAIPSRSRPNRPQGASLAGDRAELWPLRVSTSLRYREAALCPS